MSILQKGRIAVVLGAQWGDEGKGKLSDILCGEAEICARCQVSSSIGFFHLTLTYF
jgi:adenylosuccinate synthase